MYYITKTPSKLGTIHIASDGINIIGLWLENQTYFASTLDKDNTIEKDDLPIFMKAKDWLSIYFSGINPNLTLPISPTGSEFRKAVWALLVNIPYGQLTTYGDISQQLKKDGIKASPQAVGGAVGHNPISIIIPCHRVIGRNGSLTGYAGGINNKIQLLKLEGVSTEHLFIPTKGTAL